MIDLRGSRFTDIMPENLAGQLETQAFAYALGRQIEKLCAYADRVHIYADVDAMPEKILDVLAVELRTPAYNQKFPLEVKRELIEGTMTFYARMGTPAACNQIIETIFGNGYIEEWFDYQGIPHHFRVHVTRDHSVVSVAEFEEFIRAVSVVKRLSSWLDEIITTIYLPSSVLHVGGRIGTQARIGISQWADKYDFCRTIYVGGINGIDVTAGVREDISQPELSERIHTGGALGARTEIAVPGDPSPPSTTTILHTGGVYTIISNLSKGE